MFLVMFLRYRTTLPHSGEVISHHAGVVLSTVGPWSAFWQVRSGKIMTLFGNYIYRQCTVVCDGENKDRKGERGIYFEISREGKTIIFWREGGIWISNQYIDPWAIPFPYRLWIVPVPLWIRNSTLSSCVSYELYQAPCFPCEELHQLSCIPYQFCNWINTVSGGKKHSDGIKPAVWQ